MLPTLAALPEDVHHALEIRWEARLAFRTSIRRLCQNCIGWIEESPTKQTRDRRISTVLDFLKPSRAKAEQRCRNGLKALRVMAG